MNVISVAPSNPSSISSSHCHGGSTSEDVDYDSDPNFDPYLFRLDDCTSRCNPGPPPDHSNLGTIAQETAKVLGPHWLIFVLVLYCFECIFMIFHVFPVVGGK